MKFCKRIEDQNKNTLTPETNLFEYKIQSLLESLGFSLIDNDNSFYLSSKNNILVQYDCSDGNISVCKRINLHKNSFELIIDHISFDLLKKTLKKLEKMI